jgi:AcrR family transcriptional regulator
MPRPKNPLRPEQLLSHAELEFSLHGFAATRLQDIAARAGITRSSLLYHFPSKDELYKATISKSFNELALQLRHAMAPAPSPRTQLQNLVLAFDSFISARPRLARLILRELLSGHGPGWNLIFENVGPLLDQVEAFANPIYEKSSSLPLRPLLMQIAADVLLWSASEQLQEPLWGPRRDSWATASRLLFGQPED